MGAAATAIALPLGVMFLLSGFFVNLLQVMCVLFVWPISKKAYRLANMYMMEALWSELVWLTDWWAGVEIRLYTEPETFKFAGNEHTLLISNHRSDIDWLVGWVLAQRFGCLGSTRAIMKKSMQYLPVIGWSMWFSEYVFLARNWARDESTLKSGFQRLKGFPGSLWIALFVEGTRFTKAKLLAAQEFAKSSGIPIPRNVLIPRTKGFVSAVQNLRSFVPAVYDVTVAIPKGSPAPTMLRLLQGRPSVVHVHLRRCPVDGLPETDEGLAKWCREAFHIKDDLLDQHAKDNTFGEHLYRPSPRPWKPLMFVIGWTALLLPASGWVLKPVLNSWRGIMWAGGVLAVVALLMSILVLSSQSELGSSARKASRQGVGKQK